MRMDPSGDGRDVGLVPERFFQFEDVLLQEISELEYPWNLPAIEGRITEYSTFSDSINAQLSTRVMRNYNDFVLGMQQVQAVETELTLISVLIKNGRRKLKERDTGLVKGSMSIAKQRRKAQRLEGLLATLSEIQGVVRIGNKLRDCVGSEAYCQAISHHSQLRGALEGEHVRQFPALLGLREGLSLHLAVVQQKMSDGLRTAAISSEFDAERYEEILKAYGMMSRSEAASVGKELLRYVSECIVTVSRQCMLAFAQPADDASEPPEWHRKAQLKDLCRGMDPSHFVPCTAQLYEHLCDFLYRHQFLCDWHVYRAQAVESTGGEKGFHDVLTEVLTELSASKRNVWDRIQQQVSLVLMTLEFQYPALTEESFLHILHLTQLLIEEGDVFMANYQLPRSQGADGRRQWSAPIRNTLKSKAHDYFQSLTVHAWVDFRTAHIEQDTWQRLPVPRSYRLLRTERLRTSIPNAQADTALTEGSSLPKLRTAQHNPFRGYKLEPLGSSRPEAAVDEDSRGRDGADDIDEHALLQHWIEDTETPCLQEIGSAMLSNSNRSPVVSSSTAELARLLERYFRMMSAIPQLALDIFQSAVHFIEFYVHCVLCLFVQDRHLRMLLESFDGSLSPSDPKFYSRHEAFLWQQLFPELRRCALRLRDFMSTVCLPDSCATALGVQAPVTGASLLQVPGHPELNSPSSLCGLAERCVGVESVCSLLGDLRGVRSWLMALLPRGGPQEAVERFFPAEDAIASQLRSFVLMCAARDMLEVPDVGRVSLEHFSNQVQALQWEAKDFSLGSPATPYIDQMRSQIDELARRIPCTGGGSIPYATQQTLWCWARVRIMQECAEVVAKCGKRKSQEALFVLAEDFRILRQQVQLHFGLASEELQLLPPDHSLQAMVSWDFLDSYVEAHGVMPNEVLVWCKRHTEHPLRLHKSLIEYLHSSQKAQKQYLGELEVFIAAWTSDKLVNGVQTAL